MLLLPTTTEETLSMRIIKREPALLIDLFESAVVLAIALGLFHLSGESQRYLVALFIAILGLAKGFATKPFPVTVIPDLARAAFVFFGSVGLTHLTADQVTMVVTFVGTFMTLIQRAQISPSYDPVSSPRGAGSGPVTGQEGFMHPQIAVVAMLIFSSLAIAISSPVVVFGILAIVVLALWRGRTQTLRRERDDRERTGPLIH